MVSMPNSQQSNAPSGSPKSGKGGDRHGSSEESKWRLTLAESLDMHEVLHRFFSGITRRVRVSSMTFTPLGELRPVSFGSEAVHSAAYNLKAKGYSLGALTFSRTDRFAKEELETLENALAALFHPLRNALLYQEALNNSLCDQMTKLSNRAAFELAIKRHLGLSKRHGQPVSLLMLDVDHFKSINDRFGHPAGDSCLASIAKALRNTLRESDELFRYGGEEFAALLANTSRDQAMLVAERLRVAVSQVLVNAYQCEPFSTTISIGVATLKADDDRDSFISRADKALYSAKRNGRDCVIGEQGLPTPMIDA